MPILVHVGAECSFGQIASDIFFLFMLDMDMDIFFSKIMFDVLNGSMPGSPYVIQIKILIA